MHSVSLDRVDRKRLDQLAAALVAGMPTHLIIGLVGTLGAGKTTMTQAIAHAAGIDPEEVTSPTFTLLSSYDATLAAGSIRLHHLDAYRVADEDEFLELGVEELFDEPAAWTIIEWADRVTDVLPPETLWIVMEVGDDQQALRTVTFQTASADVFESLAKVTDRLTRESR